MKRIFLFIVMLSIVCTAIYAQQTLKLNKENCSVFQGTNMTIGGREAFTGTAIFKDVEFSEGTIEWDLWATGGRSYAGVIFHHQDNRDSEEFYVRPHKGNGLFGDAFQYAPVYHGVSCWQLSHGEGGTQAAQIPSNKWIHFKLSVMGDRAILKMFTERPVTMNINKLWLGNISGALGVKGPADGSTFFSNLSFSPEVDIEFPDPGVRHSDEPGIIRKWEISNPATNDMTDPYKYYDNKTPWNKVTAEKDGLVNLTKLLIRDPRQPGWVYARTNIYSDKDESRKFQIAYSDYITVFVNGKPVMSSTNAYQSRDPFFAGLIGYFDEVFLPLEKGDNEICLLIGEQFGGWAFKMRDGEAIRIAESINKLWETKSKLGYPESIVFDPETNLLYASNFMTGSGGGISKLTTKGEIIEFEWVKGLRSPTGVIIYKDNICIAERTGVVIINKRTGEIKEKIRLEGAVFPNDITVSNDGTLYITDSGGSKIYIVKEGQASVWMEGGELKNPNGIDYKDNSLYVGCTGDATIKRIDIATKKVKSLVKLPSGSVMDGIQCLDNGSLIFSDFNGHLFWLDDNGNLEEILNTVSLQVNLADFEYIKETKLIIIPGLYSNVIGAYTFK